ncbi:MAG TPA: transposase [Candidatus Sulfotelmatobacter sp.]|jgi:hypothetical protein|nr:transposase [Candidatus Sulfotelmatobacter sp.]
MSRLLDGLDPTHPLLTLAAGIDWMVCPAGSRRMSGLHLLKTLRGLHDEDLITAWEENPYFQAVCGETAFSHKLDLTPQYLVGWRAAIGLDVLDDWLADVLPRHEAPLKTFVIDVDGIVAKLAPGNDYRLAEPIPEHIRSINRLFEAGHKIVMLTARGSATGLSWEELTRKQFTAWGLKYHELRFGKPAADYYVDDRILSIDMLMAMASGRDHPPSTRAPRSGAQEQPRTIDDGNAKTA